MNGPGTPAVFETGAPGRSRVVGSLDFDTVDALLPVGSAAILGGQADVIDLAGVTDGDSAGLALLIEWLSVAQHSQRKLRYENIPAQLRQLAGLSEIEGLLASA